MTSGVSALSLTLLQLSPEQPHCSASLSPPPGPLCLIIPQTGANEAGRAFPSLFTGALFSAAFLFQIFPYSFVNVLGIETTYLFIDKNSEIMLKHHVNIQFHTCGG